MPEKSPVLLMGRDDAAVMSREFLRVVIGYKRTGFSHGLLSFLGIREIVI